MTDFFEDTQRKNDLQKYLSCFQVLYQRDIGHGYQAIIGSKYKVNQYPQSLCNSKEKNYAQNLTCVIKSPGKDGYRWVAINLSCMRKILAFLGKKNLLEARRLTASEKRSPPSEEERSRLRAEKKAKAMAKQRALEEKERLERERKARVEKLRNAFRTYPELEFTVSDAGEISGRIK